MTDTFDASRDSATWAAGDESLRLTRREHLLIAAFWLAYGFLNVANLLFGGRDDLATTAFTRAAVSVSFIEAFCWAVLTPALFLLAAQMSAEEISRAKRLSVFAGIGVVVAFALSTFGHHLREHLFPPRPGGRGGGGGPGMGPPAWVAFTSEMVIYGGVLAAGMARAYSLRYRKREQQAMRLEAQLAGAQLDALRRQLDPHFLFNTLNLISSLVERDPRGVRRMISRLSELLRVSLDSASAPEVPLRDELALLDRYADIMRMRFDGRLTVRANAEGPVLDALVPSLILQPLVENAIKHGVERTRGVSRIDVAASIDGDTAVLTVTNSAEGDDGPNEVSAVPDGTGWGVGLRNTESRLDRLYGAKGRLDFRRTETGAVVEVRVPLRRVKETS